MTESVKSDSSVSLSVVNFVDRSIDTERRLTKSELDGLKELIFERFRSEKEANTLAYIELQRRLDVLNHAHQEAKDKEAEFLPRKVHDDFYSEYKEFRDRTSTFQSNLTGKIVATIGIIGVSMGVILFLLQHFWK